MKSLILGIALIAVSSTFAQSDNTTTHQMKQRLKAKQMMKVQPEAMELNRNPTSKDVTVLSRKEVKSSVTNGVIRVKNGTPFIDVKNERVDRRMMPVNFPKSMAIDGQEIQFKYTISDLPLPKQGKCSMVINVYDVTIMKKR